jgi:hypothetical protein
MNDKYEQLKFVIQAANPRREAEIKVETDSVELIYENITGLADVLLAIHIKAGLPQKGFLTSEYSIAIDDLVNIHWDLKDDNLNHQSEECKQFLIELLTSHQ